MLLRIFRYIKKYIIYYMRSLTYYSIRPDSIIVDEKMLTPEFISVGNRVIIWHNCRIEGVKKYNNNIYQPLILIKNGARIQQNSHITCANSIIIGENTCISANVTITDINHTYLDINTPVEFQDLEVKDVVIGPDSKIYNGAVILPGVKIGKHCVIGANSVVTHDIPDYCVAVGSPAYIIKRYNFETEQWERTDKDGNIIKL